MKNLILHGSEKTPYFNLLKNGDISFGGVSMPDDAAEFYFEILDWISDYYRNPSKKTVITVSFRNINSSSSSMIFKFFHCLNRLQASGKTNVLCSWYFDKNDTDMKYFVQRIMEEAELIHYSLYPSDNILDAKHPKIKAKKTIMTVVS
jgi:hypothetical protein